jgi:hypothetical protein
LKVKRNNAHWLKLQLRIAPTPQELDQGLKGPPDHADVLNAPASQRAAFDLQGSDAMTFIST